MRILCFSDLHGDAALLEAILIDAGPVDAILIGGDITHFGTPNSAESLVRRAMREASHVLAVSGNCDSRQIDARLTEMNVSLFHRGTIHDGIGFCGVSAMPTWMGVMYELSEAEIGRALEAGYSQCSRASRQIVLSHAPPRGTSVDRTRNGAHVGSTALRGWIEQNQPDLVVCGHIHESRGIDQLNSTQLVNCGPAFQGHYAIVDTDDPLRIELRTASVP